MQGVAISSYQGGHVEYFSYLVERLAERGAGHVQVFGGGGGVIVPDEIELLRARGVHIFSPQDGQRLGLPGMINELVRDCDVDLAAEQVEVADGAHRADGRAGPRPHRARAGPVRGVAEAVRAAAAARSAPVLGITGTGGSGKSSLTDELVRRFRTRPRGQAADRRARRRPEPAPRRRRAAGRPDPDELDRTARRPVFFRSLATRGAAPGAARRTCRHRRRVPAPPASTW